MVVRDSHGAPPFHVPSVKCNVPREKSTRVISVPRSVHRLRDTSHFPFLLLRPWHAFFFVFFLAPFPFVSSISYYSLDRYVCLLRVQFLSDRCLMRSSSKEINARGRIFETLNDFFLPALSLLSPFFHRTTL